MDAQEQLGLTSYRGDAASARKAVVEGVEDMSMRGVADFSCAIMMPRRE